MDRVASTTVSQLILADLSRSFETVRRSGEELSSGRAFSEPSQNPQAMGRAAELGSALGGLEEYAANVKQALGVEQTATGALTSIGQAMQKVRQIVTQAGSGVDNTQELTSLAEVVEGLTEQVKVDANVQFGGQYIFSGTLTTTAPYSTGAEDTYHGNEATVEWTIGKGVSVGLGANINLLLGSGLAPGDNRLLDVLRTIAKRLREGTPEALAGLRTNSLEGLERNEQTLIDLQSHVGIVTDQLQHAEGTLEAMRDSTTVALGAVTEVDIARTATEYASQQVAYEAALKAGANLVQLSLLDFLH